MKRLLTTTSARKRLGLAAVTAVIAVASNAGSANAAPVELPAGPAVAGELLLRFAPHTTGAQHASILGSAGAQVVSTIPQLHLYLVKLPAAEQSSGALSGAMRGLATNPAIAQVQPNYIVHAAFVPNDPDLSQQWGLTTINAESAWDVSPGNSSVKIAIVDTGIQANHPDLTGKVIGGYDFVHNTTTPNDDNGHGTHVAGIASADTNNGVGVAGTCPDCSLLDVKVLDSTGSGTTANVISGITYAADQGAQIINLSLGAPSSAALNDAVAYAWGKGSFLSCAAGNSDSNTPGSPAGAADCFAVAATTSTDTKASFSNYGTWVKVAAPGQIIFSTWFGSTYKSLSGTSMSAPFVSGLAGLLASRGETNQQVADTICNTAAPIAGTGTDWKCGRIDAAAALAATVPHSNLTYTGAVTGDYDDPATLSATLTDASTGAAVAGKTVTFSLGAESCSATTDGSGAANCQVTPADAPGSGPYPITASFAGDTSYKPSSATTHSFAVTPEESTAVYTGSTAIPQGAGQMSLQGQLLEDGDPLVPIAGRTLTLSLGGQSCTAHTDASGSASCTVTPNGTLAGQLLTARFAGDGFYQPSTDTRKAVTGGGTPLGTAGAVTLAIETSRARITHGRTKVKLACGGVAGTCRGTLTLTLRKKGKAVPLVHARYELTSGQTEPIMLRLTRRELRLVERARSHRLRVIAAATLSGGSSTSRVVRLRS